MRHNYETTQWVPFPVPEVFAFFSNPENLPRLMPVWQQARIDHKSLVAPLPSPVPRPASSLVAGQGSVLTITFRPVPLLPIRLQWVAVISEFNWNKHFCDEQESGPFAYWKHCHTVTAELKEGIPGSSVSDRVTYALPFGFLGDIANALAIHRQMKATFAYRQSQLSLLLARQTSSRNAAST